MNESQSILYSIIYLKGEKNVPRKENSAKKSKNEEKNDCGVNGFAAYKGE